MFKKLGQLMRQRRPSKMALPDIEPPKFKTIERPRYGRTTGYAAAVLVALAGGYWLYTSNEASPQTDKMHRMEPAA